MQPFIGEIKMFAGNFAPSQYALCNGQLLGIPQNTALFSILGTFFGGDGIRTFGLPDMRSRAPIHQGQGLGLSAYAIGEVGGSENVTLLTNNLPSHNHSATFGVSNAAGTVTDPTGGVPAQINNGTVRAPKTDYFGYAAAATGVSAPAPSGMTGGSVPHQNLQPYLCVNFIIALNGIFPSRN